MSGACFYTTLGGWVVDHVAVKTHPAITISEIILVVPSKITYNVT
jgi:hypothetical protein